MKKDKTPGPGTLLLFTANDAARMLDISANTVRMHARNFNIGRKHGRDFVFTQNDINEIKKHVGKRGWKKGVPRK